MPPEPRRVLLSDATSYKAVVLAEFVKRHHPSIEVLSCDSRRGSRFLHTRYSDRHYVLGHGADEAAEFVAALRALVRETRTDLLIPVNSAEMDALMPAKADFGAALGYWGDYQAYLTLHHKDRLHSLAGSLGIRAPTRFATPGEIRPPAVAKPVARSGSKGVVYLHDQRAVDAFRRQLLERGGWSSLLVQQLVAGEGVGYSVFARDGAILAGYGHRRLLEFPPRGGSSVYREGWDDARARSAAELLLRHTHWSGFAMFEFKRTRDGELFLLEANPRIWGSIHQPLAAGVDLLEPLLGPARLPERPQLRTYFSPLVYGSLLAQALRGRLRPALDFLKQFPSNRADVALQRDPLGWLGGLLRVG